MASQTNANDDRGSTLYKDINNLRKAQQQQSPEQIKEETYKNNCVGKIAKNKYFDYFTLLVICLNAVFIGHDADYTARYDKPDDLYDVKGGVPWGFPVAENLFAAYFTGEVLVRFFAYKRKCDCMYDAWFVFDTVLVLFMVVETWVLPLFGAAGPLSQLSVLRLLRLLRITRIAKLMRHFPELQIIVKGMLASIRSVGSTAILLILVLYVWAILFTSEYHQGNLEDLDDEIPDVAVFFGSMGKSMRSLFVMGTILDDITACTDTIRATDSGTVMLIAFIIFVLVSSFTILNMLIGILCEVVSATGDGERATNTEHRVRDAIQSIFHAMDKDGDGEITRPEFIETCQNPKVRASLEELNIKPKHFDMYADLLFKAETEGKPEITLKLDDTIKMIMRLRPGTAVSALDFASFKNIVSKMHGKIYQHLHHVERLCQQLQHLSMDPDFNLNEALASRHTSSSALPLRGPSAPPGQVGLEPPAKITATTLVDLDRHSTQDILAELQRRHGMHIVQKDIVSNSLDASNLDGSNAPGKGIVQAQAFDTLCRPTEPLAEPEEWSKETYTC